MNGVIFDLKEKVNNISITDIFKNDKNGDDQHNITDANFSLYLNNVSNSNFGGTALSIVDISNMEDPNTLVLILGIQLKVYH